MDSQKSKISENDRLYFIEISCFPYVILRGAASGDPGQGIKEEMAMKKNVRFGCAQVNVTMGDFEGNAQKILEYVERAKKCGVDLVLFPECVVCGYPPEDLLLKTHFIDKNQKTIEEIAGKIFGITAVIGFLARKNKDIYNAAAVINDGKIKNVYFKRELPNYGVFDEKRYFCHGTKELVSELGGIRFAVTICEDIWIEYNNEFSGVDIILNLSASPYHRGKQHFREKTIKKYAKASGVEIIYCNLACGHDELVFDGGSFVLNKKGTVVARAKQFEEDFLIYDFNSNKKHESRLENVLDPIAEVYSALVLGTRDYVRKNGFEKVVLGISGGIDSALVAAVAVDALGKNNVVGVSMPSCYSMQETKNDAERLAANLGIKLYTIPIERIRNEYLDLFKDIFKGYKVDTTEENIQARIRGNILMAMSNKFGYLLLTTGNKSEIAVGYCTLYGDMAGGFAVIKDVPKTLVFKLCEYKNKEADEEIIPKSIIKRPPSAELRADQKDEDSLPAYEILDQILEKYVEQDLHVEDIKVLGVSKAIIKDVVRLVDLNEYKRRQSAPGIKITPKAFGKDRRLPITNKYNN